MTTTTTTADTTTTDAARAAGVLASFEVAPSHLDRALRTTVLATSSDDTLPLLTAVALTTSPAGTLVTVATDRYRLIRARVELAEDTAADLETLATAPALLPRREVRPVLAWLKPHTSRRGRELPVRVEVRGDSAGPARLHLSAPDGAAYVVNLLTGAGEFPRVQNLIPAWGASPAGECTGLVAFNPTYLAEMGKAAGAALERNIPVMVRMVHPSKPVHFRGVTDGAVVFDGVLMPVRLLEGDAAEM